MIPVQVVYHTSPPHGNLSTLPSALRLCSGQIRQPLSRPFGFPKPEGSGEVHPNSMFPPLPIFGRGAGGEGVPKEKPPKGLRAFGGFRALIASVALLSCVSLGLGSLGQPRRLGKGRRIWEFNVVFAQAAPVIMPAPHHREAQGSCLDVKSLRCQRVELRPNEFYHL